MHRSPTPPVHLFTDGLAFSTLYFVGARRKLRNDVRCDSGFCAQGRGIEVRFHAAREQRVVVDSDLVDISSKMLVY